MPAPVRHTVSEGQVFGRLTVLDPNVREPLSPSLIARNNKAGLRAARCRCECGQETVVRIYSLVHGKTNSCGCGKGNHERKPYLAERNWKHGVSTHPLYGTWLGITQRCHNPRNDSYHAYGGRGIGVHDEWLSDPRAFIAWVEANLGPRPLGHTLDRINNDGDYVPGNLQWASKSEQQYNRRQSWRRVTTARGSVICYVASVKGRR